MEKRKVIEKFRFMGQLHELTAEKLNKLEDDAWNIRFTWSPGELTFGDVIESAGHIPFLRM